MAFHRAGSQSLSLKPVLQRILLAALMLLSLMLIYMDRQQNGIVQAVQTTLDDMLLPVMQVASAPVKTVSDVRQIAGNWMMTYHENARLVKENQQLLHWKEMAHAMKMENESLRQLMHYSPPGTTSFVTAKVISYASGPYSRSVIINAGANSNVKKDQAVVSAEGLIGRVIAVGEDSARVLLLNDMSSRIPALAGNTRAVVQGANDHLLKIQLSEALSDIEVGAQVVTAADGDVFPSNLLIGTVFKKQDDTLWVRSVADMNDLHFVRVLNYAATPAKLVE